MPVVVDRQEPSPARRPRWHAPTPAKFLFAVLVMQGVLFLSAHYRWFWFNERKGYTVLITVAATAIALLLFLGCVVVSRFFKSKSQFSLSTLLLMVPVMALPCGWLARELEQARQQREIVKLAYQAKTHPLANRVETDPKDVAKTWLTETLGLDFFCDVTGLNLIDSFTDTDLERLKGLTKLQELYLYRVQVTDAGLDHLKGLAQLQKLTISQTQVTDAGLEHLKGLTKLQGLNLYNAQFTDAGLEHLKGLTQLQTLGLIGTQVTDAGLEGLKGFTQLQVRALEGSDVSDAGLEHLQGLTQLRWVHLNGTQVTDAGLEHLKGLAQLQKLSISQTQVTAAGIDQLKVALPNCMISR